MKRIHITTVLAVFSLIILAGCSGKMRHPSYYTLNLPAPPDPPAAEKRRAQQWRFVSSVFACLPSPWGDCV